MRKREQGVLTVEASIVLTTTVLLMLFLFSFAQVYNAQSVVSHAVLQASDAVALESFLRESTLTGSEADVTKLANRFMGTTTITADSYTSLRFADVPKIAKEKFIYAVANNETNADEKLKKLGIKDGLSGIDFSASKMDLGSDDVVVYVTYTIEMQYPVFGFNEFEVTKAAKSKTFGDILFGIETISEDPVMGSASGGGNYKYGSVVQIFATPNYGYKFKGWADGNTDNPRTITVTGAKTYIATFEADAFGVNLISSPASGGTTSGGGDYKYLESATISAMPADGYHFSRWAIYRHKDGTTTYDSSQTTTLNIDQTYTCTACFEKNSYNINVETSGTTSGKAFLVHNGVNKSSMTDLYQTSFKLVAPEIYGYRFLGWEEKNSGSYFSTTTIAHMLVPAKDVTYVACYESTTCTVYFHNYDGSIYATRYVLSGNSLGYNMPENPKAIGQKFNGWQGFNSGTIVHNDTHVYGSWSTCVNHRLGDCGIYHDIRATKLSAHSGAGKTSVCMCIVCADCGCYLTTKNGRWVSTSGRNWTTPQGGKIYISPSVWCIQHKNPNGNCESFKNRNSNGTYYVH